ncbi:MAG: hypothetical protein V1909_01935 [Candidatus Micrarchaeota archaeon]
MEFLKTKKDYFAVAMLVLLVLSFVFMGFKGLQIFAACFIFIALPAMYLFYSFSREKEKNLKYAAILSFIGIFLTLFSMSSYNGIATILSVVIFIIGFLSTLALSVKARRFEYVVLIVVLVLLLGALIYLGGFSPTRAPELCQMQVGMTCSKSYLSVSTDTLDITLINGLAKSIIVTGISCTKNRDQIESCDSARCPGFSGDGVITPLRSSFKALITCNDEAGNPMKFELGDEFSGKINVEYYFRDEGPGTPKKHTGNIYIKTA